jgi:hypothetical protein
VKSFRLPVSALPVFILLVCLSSSCRGPQQSYTPLGTHAFPLRGQFNQDAGRTRILILPAPN